MLLTSERSVKTGFTFALVLSITTLGATQPNPYRTVEGWAKMPDGRKWGATSAVDIDKDGRSVWVAERCGANSCLGSFPEGQSLSSRTFTIPGIPTSTF